MNKCIILLGLSGMLWFMFKLFEEIAYKYWGENEAKHRFYRTLTNVTEFIAYKVFFVTIIFVIYLYIFS